MSHRSDCRQLGHENTVHYLVFGLVKGAIVFHDMGLSFLINRVGYFW